MRCTNCDYPLKELTEHRCPECGRAFDPHDPQTFDTDSRHRRTLGSTFIRATVKSLVVVMTVSGLVTLLMVLAAGVPMPASRLIWVSMRAAVILWFPTSLAVSSSTPGSCR